MIFFPSYEKIYNYFSIIRTAFSQYFSGIVLTVQTLQGSQLPCALQQASEVVKYLFCRYVTLIFSTISCMSTEEEPSHAQQRSQGEDKEAEQGTEHAL